MLPLPLHPATFNQTVSGRFKTCIMDAATGLYVSESDWQNNLVLDQGLNGLAKSSAASLQSNIGDAFKAMQIGTGTNPNSVASGAILFVQSGNTVTATGGFFTSTMVGAILKYGTGSGGTEQYISAFTDSTHVTVTSSATVAASVGTVWFVNQTTLQTRLFGTSNYRTLTGDNSQTYTPGQVVLQRTYVVGVQGSTYTVNELGWNGATASTAISGRFVLSSSDVVTPANFYVVIFQLTVTFSPNAPASVGNVGTGINTAGNLMIEWFDFSGVLASGATDDKVGACLDDSGSVLATGFIAVSYSQQSSLTSVSSWPLTVSTVFGNTSAAAWVYTPGSVGVCTLTCTSSSTTAGQTATGIAICNPNNFQQVAADVKLTTPFTLPTGVFIPTIVWSMAYGRTLTN